MCVTTTDHPLTLFYLQDNSGFSVFRSPAKEKSFTDESLVRNEYYAEVDTLLKKRLPGVHKVFIFDHTIRRRLPGSPRQPVQQVHVDQTPEAARARVRRHLPADEVDSLLSKRFQLINVWRPIGYAATDFPLAVIDWRSTTPKDFVPVDLMYPIRQEGDDGDDRGKEICPDPDNYTSTEGYEVKGETLGVSPSEGHRFWYVKDMEPEEVMFLKCFDSWGEKVDGEGTGVDGIAVRTVSVAILWFWIETVEQLTDLLRTASYCICRSGNA